MRPWTAGRKPPRARAAGPIFPPTPSSMCVGWKNSLARRWRSCPPAPTATTPSWCRTRSSGGEVLTSLSRVKDHVAELGARRDAVEFMRHAGRYLQEVAGMYGHGLATLDCLTTDLAG